MAIVLIFENCIKEPLMQFITRCPFCFECESSIKRGMKTFSSSSFHSLWRCRDNISASISFEHRFRFPIQFDIDNCGQRSNTCRCENVTHQNSNAQVHLLLPSVTTSIFEKISDGWFAGRSLGLKKCENLHACGWRARALWLRARRFRVRAREIWLFSPGSVVEPLSQKSRYFRSCSQRDTAQTCHTQ